MHTLQTNQGQKGPVPETPDPVPKRYQVNVFKILGVVTF